jgi:hypothetical protein
MLQTNLILPGPCLFLSPGLPAVSRIRPTSARPGGAVATIQSFVADNLFLGRSKAFFETVIEIAFAADEVQRGELDEVRRYIALEPALNIVLTRFGPFCR